jgi:hypothetical protein
VSPSARPVGPVEKGVDAASGGRTGKGGGSDGVWERVEMPPNRKISPGAA